MPRFVCHICEKSYSRNHDLTRHVNIKHRPKTPFHVPGTPADPPPPPPPPPSLADTDLATESQIKSPLTEPASSELASLDPRLKHPCSILLAGSSGSGKSLLASYLVERKDELFVPPPEKVVWCYSKWQTLYDDLKEKGSVDYFVEGLEGYKVHIDGRPLLLVIDDLQREASQTCAVAELFERGSHHDNITLIYITQNVFNQSKMSRDISLNTHYLFLFKNPRDMTQIRTLAAQCCPQNYKFVVEAYNKACQIPYGYLMFDFRQDSPDILRYRTDLLSPTGCTLYTER